MDWAPKPMTLAESGIVPAWLDRSADPCTDFFAYACGGFTATATIPDDRSSWGAIEMVQRDAEEFLKKVLEDAAAKPSGDPGVDKLGAYYAACMDEGAVEAAGSKPIQPYLDQIATVTDGKSAAKEVVALQAAGFDPFFSVASGQDLADATQVITNLDQSGLGLPDRKYYLETKGTIPKTRDAYREHMVRMFQLLGSNAAKKQAANAFRIEAALAKLQQDQVVRRDPHAVYHRVERAGLLKAAASFPWADLLTALDLPTVTAINVNDPAYYPAVAKTIATESPEALRDYLTWNVLHGSADYLGKAWVDEVFAMQHVLSGAKTMPPRWRRCVHRTDRDLGELLGQSYVKAKFGGDSKARATDLTKAILGAMRSELDQLPWMDGPTRQAAREKLDKMDYLVGYPDKWRDYTFAVDRATYASNVFAARQWERHRELAKIGKPVDRHDWEMTPPTVNAYYEPSLNQLVLPAGQLQPPFFGRAFHPAVNFGDTGGGTIGHEMTHGFDDEGAEFDGNGNMRDWWSKETKAQFSAATKCIVDQYAKYEAVPGVHLDGKLTAGENIADNGGVKLAYEGYKAYRSHLQPPPPHDVEGFTDDQLYFLGYGQSWCDKATPESLETLAHINPHSPPKWRVNGVIVNHPGFASAFKCAAGTPMNPGTSCSVW